MKTYVIPVTWEVFGTVTIEAENLKEAIKLAEEAPLPDGDYVDDSFQVDVAGIPDNNDDDDEIKQELKHLYDDDFRDM